MTKALFFTVPLALAQLLFFPTPTWSQDVFPWLQTYKLLHRVHGFRFENQPSEIENADDPDGDSGLATFAFGPNDRFFILGQNDAGDYRVLFKKPGVSRIIEWLSRSDVDRATKKIKKRLNALTEAVESVAGLLTNEDETVADGSDDDELFEDLPAAVKAIESAIADLEAEIEIGATPPGLTVSAMVAAQESLGEVLEALNAVESGFDAFGGSNPISRRAPQTEEIALFNTTLAQIRTSVSELRNEANQLAMQIESVWDSFEPDREEIYLISPKQLRPESYVMQSGFEVGVLFIPFKFFPWESGEERSSFVASTVASVGLTFYWRQLGYVGVYGAAGLAGVPGVRTETETEETDEGNTITTDDSTATNQPGVTVAGGLIWSLGRAAQVGVFLGTDLSNADGFEQDGDPWISFAFGTVLFSRRR